MRSATMQRVESRVEGLIVSMDGRGVMGGEGMGSWCILGTEGDVRFLLHF